MPITPETPKKPRHFLGGLTINKNANSTIDPIVQLNEQIDRYTQSERDAVQQWLNASVVNAECFSLNSPELLIMEKRIQSALLMINGTELGKKFLSSIQLVVEQKDLKMRLLTPPGTLAVGVLNDSDASNGKGTSSTVYLGLDVGVDQPVTEFTKEKLQRDSYRLFHELVHVYHNLLGERLDIKYPEGHVYHGFNFLFEEARTVGLGKYKIEEFSENKYREVLNEPRRTEYGLMTLNSFANIFDDDTVQVGFANREALEYPAVPQPNNAKGGQLNGPLYWNKDFEKVKFTLSLEDEVFDKHGTDVSEEAFKNFVKRIREKTDPIFENHPYFRLDIRINIPNKTIEIGEDYNKFYDLLNLDEFSIDFPKKDNIKKTFRTRDKDLGADLYFTTSNSLDTHSANCLEKKPLEWDENFKSTYEIKVIGDNPEKAYADFKGAIEVRGNKLYIQDPSFSPKVRFDDLNKIIEIGYAYKDFHKMFINSFDDPIPYMAELKAWSSVGNKTYKITPKTAPFQESTTKEHNARTNIAIDITGVSKENFISKLRQQSSDDTLRLILGEDHHCLGARKMLLDAIRYNDVPAGTTIALEGLYDVYQDVLDRWLGPPKDAPLPLELQGFGSIKLMEEILRAAKDKGLSILAIDKESLSGLSFDERISRFNKHAAKVINNADPNKGFIALVGVTHAGDTTIATENQIQKISGIACYLEKTYTTLALPMEMEGLKTGEAVSKKSLTYEGNFDFNVNDQKEIRPAKITIYSDVAIKLDSESEDKLMRVTDETYHNSADSLEIRQNGKANPIKSSLGDTEINQTPISPSRISEVVSNANGHAPENGKVINALNSDGVMPSDYSIGPNEKESKKVLDKLIKDGVLSDDGSNGAGMEYVDSLDLITMHSEVLQDIKNLHPQNLPSDTYVPAYALMTENAYGGLKIPFLDSVSQDQVSWVDIDPGHVDLIKKVKSIQSKHKKINLRAGGGKLANLVNNLDDAIGVLGIINQWRSYAITKTQEEGGDHTYTVQEQLALKFNAFLSISQLAVGTSQLAVGGLSLAHRFLSNMSLSKGTSMVSKGIKITSNVGGKVLPIIGLALEVLSLASSIRELTQADTSLEKAEAGFNVGVNSVGVVVTLGVIGAGALGLATAAASLTGAGLVLIPISLVGGSVFEREKHIDSVKQVYRFMGNHLQNFKQGYTYGDANKILAIKGGLVVTKIDLKSKRIAFGSHRITGKDVNNGNNEFSANIIDVWDDFYEAERQKADKKSQDGANEDQVGVNRSFKGDVSILVLPGSAVQELAYTYARPFLRHEDKLEIDEKDEDLRNGEKIIEYLDLRKVSSGYYKQPGSKHKWVCMDGITLTKTVDTEVEVILDTYVEQVQMHNLESNQKRNSKFTYALQGDGGQYKISLGNSGDLKLTEAAGVSSTWLVYTQELAGEDDSIVFESAEKQIRIGGVLINASGIKNGRLIVQRKNGDRCVLDFEKKQRALLQMDYAEWLKNKANIKKDYVTDNYVLVKNYMKDGLYLGNAYYHVEQDSIISSLKGVEIKPTKKIIELLDRLKKVELLVLKVVCHKYTFGNNCNYAGDKATCKTYRFSIEETPEAKAIIDELLGQIGDKMDGRAWFDAHQRLLKELNASIIHLNKGKIFDIYSKREDMLIGQTSNFTSKLTVKENELISEIRKLNNNLLSRIQEVDLLSDAYLGYVDGACAYWYNLEAGLIWRTNVKTGTVEAQYKCDVAGLQTFEYWALQEVKFWLHNEQLHLKLKLVSRSNIADSLASYNSYQISDNSLKLIRVDSMSSSHAAVPRRSGKLEKFDNIKTIAAVKNSMVYHYSLNDSTSSYWSLDGGKRVKIDLPGEISYTNLVYVGVIQPETDQSSEIYFFYDSLNKKLYSQQGDGAVRELGFPKGKCVGTKTILGASFLKNNVLAFTTDEGIIYKTDDNGTFSFTSDNIHSIESTWFQKEENKGKVFENLKKLLEHTKQTVEVKGFHDRATGDKVFACYRSGKLIVMDLGELEFIRLNETGSIGYSFDSKAGKLYKHIIPAQVELANVIHASGSGGKVQLDPLKQIGLDKSKNTYSVQVHSIKRMI